VRERKDFFSSWEVEAAQQRRVQRRLSCFSGELEEEKSEK